MSYLLLLAGAVVTVALAMEHPSAWVPPCPTHRFLGFDCPGCGSMRATHLLLRGDLPGALAHNPLLVLMGVPLAALFWAEQVLLAFRGRRIAFIPRSAVLAWVALGTLLLFTLLRNLPNDLGAALRPPEPSVGTQSRSISTPPGIALRNERP